MKKTILFISFVLAAVWLGATPTAPLADSVDCTGSFTFEIIDANTIHFFSDHDGGDVAYYTWSFGDGSSSDAENPLHDYATPGTYYVCLHIHFVSGCVAEYCAYVTLAAEGEGCTSNYEYSVDGGVVHFYQTADGGGADILHYYWEFDDGTVADSENPVHTYAIPGAYIPCLTIYTADSCITTFCDTIIFAGEGEGCTSDYEYSIDGAVVHFYETADGGGADIIHYYWEFDDGTVADSENPVHTYTEPGTYIPCLTIYTADSCISTYCDTVIIAGEGAPCSVTYTYETEGTTAYFNSTTIPGPGDILSYTWNFGDGTYSDDADPDHTYTEPGTYTACITTISYDSCIATYCHEVHIAGADSTDCASHFEWDVDGVNVHFYETADGGGADIIGYFWSFGDGTSSDLENPVHEFGELGYYIVCLTIYTSDSCSSTSCETIHIEAGGGPCESNFEYTVDGTTIHFYETADGGGADILHYYWEFGDGTVADMENPVHDYAEPGTYTPCLTIYTADSCISTYCHEIHLGEDSVETECNAFFTVLSAELTGDGWLIHFNNESTADGGIGSVIWYFGDGTSADTYDAAHTYAEAGTYLVCIVITSADGTCTDEHCFSLMVGEAGGSCEAGFEYAVDGFSVHLESTSFGAGADIISYLWSFDDGTIGYGAPTNHTFSEPGYYEVCLTIITADSCIDTHCETIHIEGEGSPCTAYFAINSIEPSGDGWLVHFANESVGEYDTWHWTFGDGGTATTFDPAHTYSETGIYTVCLTMGTAGTDCYDEYCQEIFIGGDDDCKDTTLIDEAIECGDDGPQVCGCDGITYVNACIAHYHYGVLFWTEGACDAAAAIHDADHVGILNLYPNPASDLVTIAYTVKNASEVQIYVSDVVGKQILNVFTGSVLSGTHTFDMNTSNLAQGMYIVKIAADGDEVTQKLIILK